MSEIRRRGDYQVMMTDSEALQRYVDDGSQAAFAVLVQRHLNLVYSVARRQTTSSQLAEEAAQSVFIELARQARTIKPGTPLVAWLHVVSRRIALNAARGEARRRAREQAAAALAGGESIEIAAMKTPSPAPDWESIEPVLDEAIESLRPMDRAAVLLRFFENKSLREVGAVLGLSDDAAQKRVSRALEQLRAFFLRRGVATTAAGLAVNLSARALQPAPAALGPTVVAAAAEALGAAALTPLVATATMTTLQKIGVAAAFGAALAVVYETTAIWRQQRDFDELRRQEQALASEAAALRATRKAAGERLALVQGQIEGRRARTVAATPGDAALEARMRQWLNQLDQLKRFVADRAHLSIPELQLLPEEAWFTAAADGTLGTEQDFRKAAAALRSRAEGVFVSKLHVALLEYLRIHDDRLPDSPQEVAPFFDPPIEPAMLDRYEMLQRGRVADLAPTNRIRVIAPRQFPDVEFDGYHYTGPGGHGSTSAMSINLRVAENEFRKAHPGEEPVTAQQLVPYLKWPVEAGAVQELLDRQREWRAKAGDSR